MTSLDRRSSHGGSQQWGHDSTHSLLIRAIKTVFELQVKEQNNHHNISLTLSPLYQPTQTMTSSPSCFSLLFFYASSPSSSLFTLFTLRVFEASCGSPLTQLTSTHGSHPGLLLHHVTATSREEDGVCVQQDVCSVVYMCVLVKIWGCLNLLLSVWPRQSKQLLNIAAFSFLWSIRALFSSHIRAHMST